MDIELGIEDGIPESLARWLFQQSVNKRHALRKTDVSWISTFKVSGKWYTVAIDYDAKQGCVLDGDRSTEFIRPDEGWKTYDGRVADDGQNRVQMNWSKR